MRRVRILISGKVVGVGFRLSTAFLARRLGIAGWVRNTKNEKVEILAEGPKEKLKKLVEWTHQGPPMARMERIEVKWSMAKLEFENFEIK